MKKFHNYDNYPYELKEALKRDPDNKFVLGCVKFFIEKQFLSDKQKKVLSNIDAPREEYWDENTEPYCFDFMWK